MGTRGVRGGAVGVLLAIVVVLSGCGAESPVSDSPDEGRAVEQPGGSRDEKTAKVGSPARAVIHTGTLRVQVDDVTAGADDAIRIAEASNGYVGRDERRIEEDTSEATVSLRIPTDRFTSTINSLARLGKERQRKITAEDVSNAVVDLDTRIATMRASVKRTRALLDRAQSISEITSLERELTSRETELAALEARQRDLSNQIEYSTITVTFVTDETPPPAQPVGFVSGLKAGWQAFTASMQLMLMILGTVLPFLVAGAVPVTALVWLRRRYFTRNRTAARHQPLTPSAPAPPVSGPPR